MEGVSLQFPRPGAMEAEPESARVRGQTETRAEEHPLDLVIRSSKGGGAGAGRAAVEERTGVGRSRQFPGGLSADWIRIILRNLLIFLGVIMALWLYTHIFERVLLETH